jgi:hypothetical protein
MMDSSAKLVKVTANLALFHHTTVLLASVLEIFISIIIIALLFVPLIHTKMS